MGRTSFTWCVRELHMVVAMLLGPTFVWDFLWAHLPCLLDLRFADDIILFARDEREAMALLESLVSALGKTGLRLNVAKKNFTSEAQPPAQMVTANGDSIEVIGRLEAHK